MGITFHTSRFMVMTTKSNASARLVSSFTFLFPHYLPSGLGALEVSWRSCQNEKCAQSWPEEPKLLIVRGEREGQTERGGDGGCWSSLIKHGAFSCVGKGYNFDYVNIVLSRTWLSYVRLRMLFLWVFERATERSASPKSIPCAASY